ncbi:aminotransferase class III-fold pyridoxal phosphate-dependent enzyme [Pectobacterium polonicum]|uniref:Aminotransferase class III-fold pyridoxal phosphate-dependent enzyme n=1 Tax=Pectobacterium polonicum TaxID=2485124 RepID=A0AAE9NRG7_9GAMM|nr:aminotransferase class III-fold pyridoxal phosphate-dependent enzyme [Pectobacterium polonicum]UVO08403.1 aminotransferase class III-fold pyridoxal phosphate-dependent enzyme [Pectobacterium polonicum]
MTKAQTTGHWAERDHKVVQHVSGNRANKARFVLVKGKGSTVWDEHGRAFLDAHAGAWLAQVGHGRRELAQVAAQQMEQLAHFTTAAYFANPPSIELAEKLVSRAPQNIGKVRFMSSGSEADDEALQLVRLFHQRRGEPQRKKILVHRGAFHGRTYGGLELMGIPQGNGDAQVIQLTPPWSYHTEWFGQQSATDFCLQELDEAINEHGAENIAALFGELVWGPAGMIPAPDDYWPKVAALLKKHGILFVVDEVVTAFGRAGAWFTANDYQLTPDVIVLAKGIASGYMPIAALLLSESFAETVEGAGGGGSFAGHLVACAVARANIDIIENEQLVQASRTRSEQLLKALTPLNELGIVGNIRGRGLMIGLELVADKSTKVSLFRHYPELLAEIPRFAREDEGVILSIHGGALSLTPPLVITADEVERLAHTVENTLKHATAYIGRK